MLVVAVSNTSINDLIATTQLLHNTLVSHYWFIVLFRPKTEPFLFTHWVLLTRSRPSTIRLIRRCRILSVTVQSFLSKIPSHHWVWHKFVFSPRSLQFNCRYNYTNISSTQCIEIPLFVPVTCICCVSISQMMVATKSEKVLRIRWDGVEERDFSLDLKRIPFSINQQVSYGEWFLKINELQSNEIILFVL